MKRSEESKAQQKRTMADRKERGLKAHREAIVTLKQAIKAEKRVNPMKMNTTQLLTRLALAILEGRA